MTRDMTLTIAIGQFNSTVGDISGNVEAMKGFYGKAVERGADILVLPELCLCGYPPEDLLRSSVPVFPASRSSASPAFGQSHHTA